MRVKKSAVLACVLALILVFSACSSSNDGEQSPAPAPPPIESTQKNTTAPPSVQVPENTVPPSDASVIEAPSSSENIQLYLPADSKILPDAEFVESAVAYADAVDSDPVFASSVEADSVMGDALASDVFQWYKDENGNWMIWFVEGVEGVDSAGAVRAVIDMPSCPTGVISKIESEGLDVILSYAKKSKEIIELYAQMNLRR